MSDNNKISVALCTFNGERYLLEQLNSIARQTSPPAELVICDDQSTDSTASIVKQFAKTVDFTVHLHRNERNLGSTKNFEKAISLCSEDLIALSDQDDIWYPQKLELLHRTLKGNPELGGIFSDGDMIDEDSMSTSGTLWRAFGFDGKLRRRWQIGQAQTVLLQQEVVTGATMMFRARLKNVITPIPPEWIHDAWIAWIIAMTSRLGFVNTRLIQYRIHAEQQEGVPRGTRLKRFRKALAGSAARDTCAAQKFQVLRDRLKDILGSEEAIERVGLNEKIAFQRFRASLPDRGISRVFDMLSRFREYARYSRGLPEFIKDLTCV